MTELRLLGHVALKSHFGRYLCCENVLFGQLLVFDRLGIEEWEIFELFINNDSFAFKAHNGRFICVIDNQLSCQRYIGKNCLFKMGIVQQHDDFAYRVSFQSNSGYLSANRIIPCLKEWCREWELFTMEILPNLPYSHLICHLTMSKQHKSIQTMQDIQSHYTQTDDVATIQIDASDDDWMQIKDFEE